MVKKKKSVEEKIAKKKKVKVKVLKKKAVKKSVRRHKEHVKSIKNKHIKHVKKKVARKAHSKKIIHKVAKKKISLRHMKKAVKKGHVKKISHKSMKKKEGHIIAKKIHKIGKIRIHKIKPGERVKTGIPNFDTLIEGGFEGNSTNLVVGDSGSGKSIFATQFLIEGMKRGEKCLYVTFEEKKQQFYSNMLEFGWDLEVYEKKGLFTFLEYTPSKVKTMLEEGGGAIESLVLSQKISRIVIDSITSFALLFEDELSKREAAFSLFNMIKKWSCTSLLTSEEPIGSGGATKSIEFESDSIILLYFIRKKEQRQRYLEVLKMRGTKHSKRVYDFSIDKHGISVDKSPSKDPPNSSNE